MQSDVGGLLSQLGYLECYVHQCIKVGRKRALFREVSEYGCPL